MSSGISLGFGGSFFAGFSGGFSGSTLGDFIREAQLDDFLYSYGGPQKITSSRDLPGSTHWDPAPVPVGDPNVSASAPPGESVGSGSVLPSVVVGWDPFPTPQGTRPDVVLEGGPPVVFSAPPILLPGQTDPGREEWETKQGEKPVAGFWDFATTVAQPFLPGFATPGFAGPSAFVAGPGQVAGPGGAGGGGAAPPVAVGMPGCEPPKKWCYNTETGKYTPYRRRRRRKMLTATDMNQLVQLGTLPNNANVRVALAKRIR